MMRLIPPTGGKIVGDRSAANRHMDSLFPIGSRQFTESGTAALALAIQDALCKSNPLTRLPAEVIIPAYCCPDVLSAVRYAGAKPVLVDFVKNEPRLDLNQLAESITDQTIAVVAINFLGLPERLNEIKQVLPRKDISLINDCCQTFPIHAVGRSDATYSVFSFGRGKPIPLCHGGLLISADKLSEAVDKRIAPASNGIICNVKYCIKIGLFHAGQNELLFPIARALRLAGKTQYKSLENISNMCSPALSILDANIDQYLSSTGNTVESMQNILKHGGEQIIDLTSTIRLGGKAPRLLRYPILLRSKRVRNLFISLAHKNGICVSSFYNAILPEITSCRLPPERQKYKFSREFADRLATIPVHSGMTKAGLTRMGDAVTKFRTITENRNA